MLAQPHGALDQDHMRFFERLMNRIDDPDDQAAIIAMSTSKPINFPDASRYPMGGKESSRPMTSLCRSSAGCCAGCCFTWPARKIWLGALT